MKRLLLAGLLLTLTIVPSAQIKTLFVPVTESDTPAPTEDPDDDIRIETTSLSGATEDTAYSSGAISVVNGNGPSTCALAEGSDPLPDGLDFGSTCADGITGTPTASGTYTFTVEATGLVGDTPFVSDSFTDTEDTEITSHTGETGATWAKQASTGGTFSISDANRVFLSATAAGSNVYASGTPASADYYVQAVIHRFTDLNYLGVIGRAATDTGVKYACLYIYDQDKWRMARYPSSGAATTIGTDYTQTLVNGQDYTVRLTMIGSRISCSIDGVERIVATDANITTAGKGGIVASGAATSSTGYHLDNFRASDLVESTDTQVYTITVAAGEIPEPPSPWVQTDIGSPATSGETTYDDGPPEEFTVKGAGTNFGSTSDQGHFVYQLATDDVTVTARSDSFTSTATSSKGGVMIRASLDANAPFIYMFERPNSGGVSLCGWRTSAGATAGQAATGTVTDHHWFRVIREGDQFSCQRSDDGTTWDPVGSTQTITMSSTVYVGLAVSSLDVGTLATLAAQDVTVDDTDEPEPDPEEQVDYGGYRPDIMPVYGGLSAGGRGGIICAINSLADTVTRTQVNGIFYRGTYRGCIAARSGCDGTAAKCARFVICEISGTIDQANLLNITSPYLTVAWQTCPSPGLTLHGRKGCGRHDTHDLIYQHFRCRRGHSASYPDGSDLIAMWFRNDVYNVLIDHSTFSWGMDETLTFWNQGGVGDHPYNIYVRNTIISEGLFFPREPTGSGPGEKIHPSGTVGHSTGTIWAGSSKGTIVWEQNVLAHHNNRFPLMQKPWQAIMRNNVNYNAGNFAQQTPDVNGALTYTHFNAADSNCTPTASWPFNIVLVGNQYINGPGYRGNAPGYTVGDTWSGIKAVKIRSAPTGSHFWFDDNVGPGFSADDQFTDLAYQCDGITEAMKDTAEPSWFTAMGFPAAIPSEDVLATVLPKAGARPLDRDVVDARIIQDVVSGTGGIIDSPSQVVTGGTDAFGFPTLASNTRAFTIAGYADPNDWWDNGDCGSLSDGTVRTVLECAVEECALKWEDNTTEHTCGDEQVATLVPSGTSLSTAIADADYGDILELEQGATFTGNFVCSGNLTIRTQGINIAQGTRVTSALATNFATLHSTSSTAAYRTAAGASSCVLENVKLTTTNGAGIALLQIGDTLEDGWNDVARRVALRHIYIDGGGDQKRCVSLNAIGAIIEDSYIVGCAANGQDAQAIWINTCSNCTIRNNHLEASSEPILTGGDRARIDKHVPSFLLIEDNEITRPSTWRTDGNSYNIKNLLELKSARYVTIRRNYLHQNWADAQTGETVLFTPKNQYGDNTWATVEYVSMYDNYIEDVASCWNMTGNDADGQTSSPQANHISITNNICITDTATMGGVGRCLQHGRGMVSLTYSRNTCIGSQGSAPYYAYGGGSFTKCVDCVFKDNVGLHRTYGFTGASTAGNIPLTISTWYTNLTASGNVMMGGSGYPAGFTSATPNQATFEAGFTDYSKGFLDLTGDWAGKGSTLQAIPGQ